MGDTVIMPSDAINGLKVENKIPVDAANFDKICRTCLSTQKIQSIFTLKYNELEVLQLLDSCVSIQVS